MLEGSQQQRFTFSLGFGLLLVGKKRQKKKKKEEKEEGRGEKKITYKLPRPGGLRAGGRRQIDGTLQSLNSSTRFVAATKGGIVKATEKLMPWKGGHPRAAPQHFCRWLLRLFGAARRRRRACVTHTLIETGVWG